MLVYYGGVASKVVSSGLNPLQGNHGNQDGYSWILKSRNTRRI